MAWQPGRRFERVETSSEIIKRSIAEQIREAQLKRSVLYHILITKSEDTPKIIAFQEFLTAFYSLFQDTKHNIERSIAIGKDEWKEKKEKYSNFLNLNINNGGKRYTHSDMAKILELFDDFQDDMVRVGLFNLLEEVAEGGESNRFGDEVFDSEE
jgi:viroplasmin and RNaseH domain-containing protein